MNKQRIDKWFFRASSAVWFLWKIFLLRWIHAEGLRFAQLDLLDSSYFAKCGVYLAWDLRKQINLLTQYKFRRDEFQLFLYLPIFLTLFPQIERQSLHEHAVCPSKRRVSTWKYSVDVDCDRTGSISAQGWLIKGWTWDFSIVRKLGVISRSHTWRL